MIPGIRFATAALKSAASSMPPFIEGDLTSRDR
jgi:hypothetical protein